MSSENAHIATLRDKYTKHCLHEVTRQDKTKVIIVYSTFVEFSAVYRKALRKFGHAYNGEPT